jgi:hypothetical protein
VQEAGEASRNGGSVPEGLYLVSHEDIENLAPLNTEAGCAFVDELIKGIGGVDLIVFDNIMSLVSGDQKDEESWRGLMPWFRSLTKRSIAQFWVHHTGHDTSHSYGTKIREWQMDTVIKLTRKEGNRNGDGDVNDVNFILSFQKARERVPATGEEFADVEITLADNEWTSMPVEMGAVADGKKEKRPPPTWREFLDAFTEALDTRGTDYHVTGSEDEIQRKNTMCTAFRRMLVRAKDNGFAIETAGATEWIWRLE